MKRRPKLAQSLISWLVHFSNVKTSTENTRTSLFAHIAKIIIMYSNPAYNKKFILMSGWFLCICFSPTHSRTEIMPGSFQGSKNSLVVSALIQQHSLYHGILFKWIYFYKEHKLCTTVQYKEPCFSSSLTKDESEAVDWIWLDLRRTGSTLLRAILANDIIFVRQI